MMGGRFLRCGACRHPKKSKNAWQLFSGLTEAIKRLELLEPFDWVNILGFGSLAKVLEPASLVKEIKDELGKSLKFYAKA